MVVMITPRLMPLLIVMVLAVGRRRW